MIGNTKDDELTILMFAGIIFNTLVGGGGLGGGKGEIATAMPRNDGYKKLLAQTRGESIKLRHLPTSLNF